MQSQGGPLMIDGGTEVTKFQSPWETQRLVASKECYLVLSATLDCLHAWLGCQGALHIPVWTLVWLI